MSDDEPFATLRAVDALADLLALIRPYDRERAKVLVRLIVADVRLIERLNTAQGIEARSGETVLTGSTEGESPVATGDAP